MANITLLPSAKVPLVYEGENTMTTEWYRFFWNIYGFTGTGVVPVNKGGTGLDTIGNHQLIIGNTNNVFEPASLSSASIAITYPAGFINLELGTSGVTPGTYGSASTVGVFTVNAYGVLTAASNTSIGIDASQIISGTIASARVSGSYTGITGVGTLTAGTWNASTIGTAYGGTGLTSFTSGGALYATSTSALISGTLPVTAGGTSQTSFTNGQLLIGNTTGNTLTKATLTAGSGVSITNGAGSITISATGTGGTVTSVSGTSPISVATGTTTPVISISQANTSTNGYLSSTDWNTFNNKQPAGSYLTAVSVVSANGFAGTSSGGTTPALTLSTNITGLLIGNGTAMSAATIGTGLSLVGSTLSNSAPDQIVSLTGAGTTTVTGTYPSFTITSNDAYVGTVTSVSGTGSVNGITLTGTVTSSGSLTLGGTLSGIGNSQLTNSTISGVALGGNLFNLTAGTGVSFSAGTTYNGSAAITINATGTGGTVTSVTGTAPVSVATGTTTPVISMAAANTTTNGYLTSTDWNTFNGKAPAVTYTTNYIPFGQGTTTLNQSANLTWSGTNLKAIGSITSSVANSATKQLSLSATNGANADCNIWLSTNYTLIAPSTATPLAFGTATTEQMRLFSSGGVSIGNTTDPGATNLSVTGTVKTSGALLGSSTTLLNDYQEGTFTPTYSSWTINPTTSNAFYTKIGRQVTINMLCAEGVTVGGGIIGNLPFTSKANQGATATIRGINSNINGVGSIPDGSTQIQNIGAMTNTGYYWTLSVTYIV